MYIFRSTHSLPFLHDIKRSYMLMRFFRFSSGVRVESLIRFSAAALPREQTAYGRLRRLLLVLHQKNNSIRARKATKIFQEENYRVKNFPTSQHFHILIIFMLLPCIFHKSRLMSRISQSHFFEQFDSLSLNFHTQNYYFFFCEFEKRES